MITAFNQLGGEAIQARFPTQRLRKWKQAQAILFLTGSLKFRACIKDKGLSLQGQLSDLANVHRNF